MSSKRCGSALVLQPSQVVFDAGDHAGMAGHLGVPAARLSVVAQRRDVGELGLQLWQELGGGDEVVALLADVGIRASLGGQVT